MRSFCVALVALLATAICGNATLAGGSFEKAAGEWASVWESESGRTMTSKLKFDGSSEMVYIPDDGSTVNFQSAEDNGKWEGYWIESSGSQRCDTKIEGSHYWGMVLFQFNETYNEFVGTWDNCGEGKKFEWTGERVTD